MDSMKERRQYIRADMPIPVKIRVKEEGTIKEMQLETKNISARGMLVEIDKKIPNDTAIELSLKPQAALNPIHISAKVIRVEKAQGKSSYYTGIEFIKIEEDNKNTFLKFLCDAIYKMG